MPEFGVAGTAHLDSGDPTLPVFLAYFDVLDDPIRATTLGYPITLPAHADPDLSEQTFYPTAGVLSVGDVVHTEGGSETLTVELSGLLLPDNDLLNKLAVKQNWQRRPARLWVLLRGQGRVNVGTPAAYYTGEMSSDRIRPGRDRQSIIMEIEGYKALLTRASGRGYGDQSRYDPDDHSWSATVGSANGARSGPAAMSGGGSGIGGNRTEDWFANTTSLAFR